MRQRIAEQNGWSQSFLYNGTEPPTSGTPPAQPQSFELQTLGDGTIEASYDGGKSVGVASTVFRLTEGGQFISLSQEFVDGASGTTTFDPSNLHPWDTHTTVTYADGRVTVDSYDYSATVDGYASTHNLAQVQITDMCPHPRLMNDSADQRTPNAEATAFRRHVQPLHFAGIWYVERARRTTAEGCTSRVLRKH